jgi:hypothetical protein
MRNRVVVLSLLVIFCVAMLLAADFWKAKKYTEWTDKEVDKMLNDSPWAKKTDFTLTGGGGRGGGGAKGGGGGMAFLSPQDEGGGGGAGGGGGGGGRGGGGGGGGKGGGAGGGGAPMVESLVRWQTALPIRQVIALARVKAKAITAEEADKALGQEPTHYVLALYALPASALRTEDEFKAGAVLKIKDQPDLLPVQVTFQKLQGGGHVFLFFAKTGTGGYTIKSSDKEVELVLKTKSLSGKRKFSLKDLEYNGKLEL